MGVETVLIGALQLLASLVRSVLDGLRGRRRSAAGRLAHVLAMKREVNAHLWGLLAETNGDAIICELRRKDSYPEVDESLRSTSRWFKVELKGTYHAGIEVFTSIQNVVVEDGVARPAAMDVPDSEAVHVVGRIPYEAIEGVDWDGDEYHGFTHIYCRFRIGRRRGPFAETVLYETDPRVMSDGRKHYERLDGVKWKPKRRGLVRRFRDRRALRKMDRN